MALTVTRLYRPKKRGARKVTYYEITFDNSYESGGETLAPSSIGLRRVEGMDATMVNGSESATLRPTNAWYSGGKIHLNDSATGKEMEATKDVSKVKVTCEFEGV